MWHGFHETAFHRFFFGGTSSPWGSIARPNVQFVRRKCFDDVLGTSAYKSYKSLILLKGMWRFSGSCISLWWTWEGHLFFSQSEEHLPDNSCPLKSIEAQVIVWDGWSISFPIRINYRTVIEMPCWNAKSLSSKSRYTPKNERLEPRNPEITQYLPIEKGKIISTKPPFFTFQNWKKTSANLTTSHLVWVPILPVLHSPGAWLSSEADQLHSTALRFLVPGQKHLGDVERPPEGSLTWSHLFLVPVSFFFVKIKFQDFPDWGTRR